MASAEVLGDAVGANVGDDDEDDDVDDADDVDDVASLKEVDAGSSEDDVLVLETSLDVVAELVITASIVDMVEVVSLFCLLIQN